MKNQPVGVFDSGLGGLTVLRELVYAMPGEDFIYFGDSRRAPYGTKSQESIIAFSLQDMRFLMTHGVKAAVVACNTASSNAMEDIRRIFHVPVMEVTEPGSEEAVRITRNKRIGVIGTDATIRSRAYETAILRMDPAIRVFSMSCPLFVPIVEESEELWSGKLVEMAAENYLGNLKKQGVDTLVLGCTHYPLIKDILGKVMGNGVTLVDSARAVAGKTREMLEEKGLFRSEGSSRIRLFTSDNGGRFLRMSRAILDIPVESIETVDIERY